MGYPVTLNGRTYTLADFSGQNYAAGFPDALSDFVTDAGAKTTAAASSATAAAASETAAAASAAAAAASVNAIEGFYLGAQASNPTVDLNGAAVTVGDFYFNTATNQTRIYNGSSWDVIAPDLVGDSTPQLGGNLDVNGNAIVSTSNGNIAITPNGTGEVDISKVDIDGGAIDGTVIGASSAAAGTFTTFTSTGIDDNGTSTAITIDASEQVGIGLPSPEKEVEILLNSTTTTTLGQKGGLQFRSASSTVGNGGEITWSSGTGNTERWCAISGHITTNTATGSVGDLVFATKGAQADTSPTEAMRIHSDGDISVTANGGGASNSGDIVVNSRAKFGYDGSRAAAVISDQGTNKSIVFDTNGSERVRITTTGDVEVNSKLSITDSQYENHLELNRSSEQWRFSPSTDGSLDIRRVGGTGTASLDILSDTTVDGSLTVGDGTNIASHIAIKPADDTVADDLQFFNGTTRIGEIGTQDSTWLRINQETAKNIYTPRYIRADGGLFVSSGLRGINSSGVLNAVDGSTITGSGDTVFTVETTGTSSSHDAVLRLSIGGTTGDSIIQFGDSGDLDVGRLQYDHSINAMRFFTNAVEDMRLTSGGNLHVDADVIAFSTTISDERMKENVQGITGALDTVDALRGVTYTWNTGSRKGQRDYGVIAQEVEQVIPEIVYETEMPLLGDEETLYKTVDYEKLCAVLISAVSELRAEVEALKRGAPV